MMEYIDDIMEYIDDIDDIDDADMNHTLLSFK